MSSFLRIIKIIKSYSGYVILNISSNIISILFSLASFAVLIPVLNFLFDKTNTSKPIPPKPEFALTAEYIEQSFNHWFLPLVKNNRLDALLAICFMVVVVFFMKNLFRYIAAFALAPIRNGVIKDIRNALYIKLTGLPLSYFTEERKGNILTRMTSDVQQIEHNIINTLEVMIKEPLTIIFYFGLLFYFSPMLTLFVIVMILLAGGVVGSIGKTLKRTSTKGQEKLAELISIIDESLGGIRIIKAFTAELQQQTKFENYNKTHAGIMTRIHRRKALSSPLTEFLSFCIIAVVLWYGGSLVLSDDVQTKIEPSVFIAFLAMFAQLIPSSKSISSAFYNIQQGLASADRVFEVLDTELKIPEKPDAKSIESFKDALEFKEVSFAYNNYDDKLIINDINLTIKKGKMVALVGPSGAGKSTLADLIPRFYDVQEGSIIIDDNDIRNYKVHDLRKLMGIVSQEAILFNDTVFNNIAFGKNDVSQEEVVHAAKIANAHEFIENLENKYQTHIGDMGNKLSGGQRQRLTIARAILNDPPILILDEATSALDTESEKLVQDAIYKLMQNRTSLVIAHRLSTIQYADEILVIADGKVIERGNHISLMAKNGTYKKLVDLQGF